MVPYLLMEASVQKEDADIHLSSMNGAASIMITLLHAAKCVRQMPHRNVSLRAAKDAG